MTTGAPRACLVAFVVMNAGRVVDSGSPAELVERHGRTATIRFTVPPGSGWSSGQLAGLPGVDGVDLDGDRVTVRGDRGAIAHVGAALVEGGWVPPDLSVQVPPGGAGSAAPAPGTSAAARRR